MSAGARGTVHTKPSWCPPSPDPSCSPPRRRVHRTRRDPPHPAWRSTAAGPPARRSPARPPARRPCAPGRLAGSPRRCPTGPTADPAPRLRPAAGSPAPARPRRPRPPPPAQGPETVRSRTPAGPAPPGPRCRPGRNCGSPSRSVPGQRMPLVVRQLQVGHRPPDPTPLPGITGYRSRRFRGHLSAGPRAGEGLPSSRRHHLNVPRPIRRAVPHGCTSRVFTASMAFAPISRARHCLHPPHRGGPVTTPQASRDATDRSVAPPTGAFDTGLRRRAFPPDAASLLPGLLAATRTGLPPAGDDELTNTRLTYCSTMNLSFRWAHQRWRLGSSFGAIG